MPGLFFDSGINDGFNRALRRMNSDMNSFSKNVTSQSLSLENSFKKLAAQAAATFGTAKLVQFGKESVTLYLNQQKALAQVEQGLKSTGNAAHQTFAGLQKEAADLQKKTLFGDEDILQNATAQLLTFTNIANDNFTRTQKVALDLATRLDGDLKSASIQLGKALNDPVANLSALSRSGIQFSDQQKEVINNLASTNRLAEAQTIILDELERQYGGSAEAAGKADHGFTQLNNAFGDAREVIGGVIVEGLEPLIQELKSFFENLSEHDIRDFLGTVKDVAKVVAVLVTAITAWKLSLAAMNLIQKANTALALANVKAQRLSALTGKEVSTANLLMAKSFKQLKLAFAANPIGLLVTGLTLALPLISTFISESSEAEKTQAALNEVMANAKKSIAGQKVELDRLLTIARDENRSLAERQEAIDKLNKISPEYLGNLNLQTINTESAKKATDAYSEALLRNARVQAAQEKLVELEKELIDLRETGQGTETKWYQILYNNLITGGNVASAALLNAEDQIDNLTEKEKELLNIRDALLKIVVTEPANTPTTTTTTSTFSQEEADKQLKVFKKLLSDQKKAYEEYTDAIDGLSGDRLLIVNDEYTQLTKKGKTYLEFLTKLLEVEKNAAKRDLISSEIRTIQLQNIVTFQQDAQEEIDTQKKATDDLLKLYASYTQKRQDIENKYFKIIDDFRIKGYDKQAEQAKYALDKELKALDDNLLANNEHYQKWLENTLPKITKAGIAQLQKELGKLQLDLKTKVLTPEQVVEYKAQIQKLLEILNEKTNVEKTSEEVWKSTLEVMNGVNTLMNDVIVSFDNLDESTKRILQTTLELSSGTINLISAFKAVGQAASALDKASAILAAISAVMKIINSLSKAYKEEQEARVKAHIAELNQIQKVNIALIEQNKLYAQGNSYFSNDKWGTALKGLDAYNSALKAQNELLLEAANARDEDLRKIGGIALFGKNERERRTQSIIRDYAKNFSTTLEQALAGISVKTKDRSGIANFFGAADQYDSLLRLYPKLIDANGELDTILLQSIVDTKDLTDTDKARLTNLIELANSAQEAFSQFGEYVSSIFGGIGDEIAQAFFMMYKTGDDAMTALQESFSRMIEKFTQDAIEFAFLQPYLNSLNETTQALGEQYAKGQISADKLQEGIISSLGDFYNTLGQLSPQILEAFRQADVLAANAGFDSAFNNDIVNNDIGTTVQDPVIVDDISSPTSVAGQIQQTISQETGTVIEGRLGAIMLDMNRVVDQNQDMLDYAIQHLLYLKQIKVNTDYLPEIADNTRKTYQKLESI